MMTLIKKIIDAHGGAKYWNTLEALDADISAKGFLFTTKHMANDINNLRPVRASFKE